MSRLVIFEGETQRAEHELARAVVGLGRHPQNDIVLDDRTLSRFHARIERRDERYVVVDLGAQNGVHLNGERIEGEALLSTGDRIELGRYTAIFQAPARVAKNGKNGHASKAAATTPDPDLDLDLDLDMDIDLDLDGDDLGLDDDLGLSVDDGRTGIASDFNDASQVEYVPPQPTLVLLFNGMEVSRHPLNDAGLVVGRSKQCDVVISLLGLSRRHSKIAQGDEGAVVQDLGSQNGTWVNNERIEGSRVLQHGDILNFYDYSVLFLEDGDVEVGFPGAGFSPPQPGVDDLAAKDTDQAALGAPAASAKGKPRRPPTQRSPLADDAPPEDETALGRARPGSKRRTDDHLNLDDLGEGSYLGDEFEEGASKNRDNPLLDDDDLDDVMAPAPSGGMGTELIDSPDLSRGAADEDLEADVAFSSSASDDDFVGPTTAGDMARLNERTSTGVEALGGLGGWPSDDDLEGAMMVLEQTSVTLEVTMKGKPYAQIPLNQPVMRLGSDPRCEISMPKSSGLRAWHVTFAQVGPCVMVMRTNRAASIERDGREVDAAILNNGDTIQLGKVEILLRMRR